MRRAQEAEREGRKRASPRGLVEVEESLVKDQEGSGRPPPPVLGAVHTHPPT